MAFGCGTGVLKVRQSEVDIIEEVSYEVLGRGGSWLSNWSAYNTVIRLRGREACGGARPLDGEPGNDLRPALVFEVEIFPAQISDSSTLRVADYNWNHD